uniref:Uncharacterized protein n=1 Tax=Tetranychus urticae TaxID=32264 RepID=T1K401_TETUR
MATDNNHKNHEYRNNSYNGNHQLMVNIKLN